MKTGSTWFDRIMAAVTFAEANEYDAANELVTGVECKLERDKIRCRECDAVPS